MLMLLYLRKRSFCVAKIPLPKIPVLLNRALESDMGRVFNDKIWAMGRYTFKY